MTHIPGGTGQDARDFIMATQNGTQVETYKLFISGVVHLIFSDFG